MRCVISLCTVAVSLLASWPAVTVAQSPGLPSGRYNLQISAPVYKQGEAVDFPAVITAEKSGFVIRSRGLAGNEIELPGVLSKHQIKFGATETDADALVTLIFIGKMDGESTARGTLTLIQDGKPVANGTWTLALIERTRRSLEARIDNRIEAWSQPGTLPWGGDVAPLMLSALRMCDQDSLQIPKSIAAVVLHDEDGEFQLIPYWIASSPLATALVIEVDETSARIEFGKDELDFLTWTDERPGGIDFYLPMKFSATSAPGMVLQKAHEARRLTVSLYREQELLSKTSQSFFYKLPMTANEE